MFRDLSFSSLPSDLYSLLYGSTNLTHNQNELLFEIVRPYIKETTRFSLRRLVMSSQQQTKYSGTHMTHNGGGG